MIKKIVIGILLTVWFLFGIYLLLPSPTIPDLPNAEKSTLPGDTVQVANVAGYYDDLTREQVMAYYKGAFTRSPLFHLPFPTIDLNHPPEYAKQRVRNEIQAWYFEELVHPFRESLYVTGWTPALAQESLGIRYEPVVDQNHHIWYQKTTIRLIPTSLSIRIANYLLVTILLVTGYFVLKRILGEQVYGEQN